MDDPLDDDFPLGDGSADLDAEVMCPYCAQPATIALDPGSGESQQYVEDCPVCCQPWQVHVRYDAAGVATVSIDQL
jgi:Cysteine-rich CPXCG